MINDNFLHEEFSVFQLFNYTELQSIVKLIPLLKILGIVGNNVKPKKETFDIYNQVHTTLTFTYCLAASRNVERLGYFKTIFIYIS